MRGPRGGKKKRGGGGRRRSHKTAPRRPRHESKPYGITPAGELEIKTYPGAELAHVAGTYPRSSAAGLYRRDTRPGRAESGRGSAGRPGNAGNRAPPGRSPDRPDTPGRPSTG